VGKCWYLSLFRAVDAVKADMFMVLVVHTFDGVAVENAVNVGVDSAGVSPSIFMDSGSFLSKNFR